MDLIQASTLGTLLTDVCSELGVNTPGTFVANADLSAKQFVALAQTTGDQLMADYNWQAIIVKYSFSTVAGTPDYALPADFGEFIDETQWNLTSRWPVQGPRTQRTWAQVEGFTVNIGPYFAQQLRSNRMYLQPTPTGVQSIFFYYLSRNWIAPAANPSVPVSRWTSDDDQCIFSDALLKAGIKWRWLRAKRMSYDEEYKDFEDLVSNEVAADRGARTVSLDPGGVNSSWGTGIVVPVTGFGG